jgi:hypothetical protein
LHVQTEISIHETVKEGVSDGFAPKNVRVPEFELIF